MHEPLDKQQRENPPVAEGAELPLGGLLADLLDSWEEPAEREVIAASMEEPEAPDFKMLAAALAGRPAEEPAEAPLEIRLEERPEEPASAASVEVPPPAPAVGSRAWILGWDQNELREGAESLLPGAASELADALTAPPEAEAEPLFERELELVPEEAPAPAALEAVGEEAAAPVEEMEAEVASAPAAEMEAEVVAEPAAEPEAEVAAAEPVEATEAEAAAEPVAEPMVEAAPEPTLEPVAAEAAETPAQETEEELQSRLLAEAVVQNAAELAQLARFVAFECAGRQFALALEQVSEVERVPRVTAVPGSPPAMCGLINRRGDIIPLIDLRLLLNGSPHDDPASGRLVMLTPQPGQEGLAYLVDGLTGLAALDRAAVEPPQPATDGESWTACLAGRSTHRGRELLILDPNALREETHRCFEI